MKKIFLFSLVVLTIALTSASVQAATSWYFPEGCTRGFDLWILVVNTNATDASVTYTFYLGSTGTPETHTETVEANKRKTIKVNDYVGNDEDVSTKVECTNGLNIYAERAMYWSESVFPTWQGGHTSRGIRGVEGCYTEISQPSSFPITISSSGSYKLTGNITCSTNNVNAITITADNVTLDLNGFTITGPGYSHGDSGNGIQIGSGTAIYNITITNGNIKNFRKKGIYEYTARMVTLTNLNLYHNGEWGVYLAGGYPGMVENCLFRQNGPGDDDIATGGLRIYCNTIVRNNNMYWNEGYGIYVASSENIIERNSVSTTSSGGTITESGIYVNGSRNRIEGNHCMDNDTSDINLAGSSNLCINNSVDVGVVSSGPSNKETATADQGNTTL